MSDQTNETNSPKQNRFDQLMFGSRSRDVGNKTEPSQEEKVDSGPTTSQGEFDMFQMLQSVDELMGNFKQIKPMIQQLTPLLDFFKQKK